MNWIRLNSPPIVSAIEIHTGTADTAVFKNPVDTNPARVLERVRERYADAGLTLLPPLGFENTFAILVRGDDASGSG